MSLTYKTTSLIFCFTLNPTVATRPFESKSVTIMASVTSPEMDIFSDSDSSDSGKSDDLIYSDTDILEQAGEIMQDVSPVKPSKSKRIKSYQKDSQTVTDGSSSTTTPKLKHEKKKKKLKLKKADNLKISHELKASDVTIADQAIESVKNEHFWRTMEHGSEFICDIIQKDTFKTLVRSIVQDYACLYNMHHRGQSPYQDFQISWFQNARKYLAHADPETQNQMKELCGNFGWDYKSNLISVLHSAVSENCSHFIINCIKGDDPRNEEHAEKCITPNQAASLSEDYLIFKLHGWIIREIRSHPNLKTVNLSKEDTQEWQENINKVVADKSTDSLPKELSYIDFGKHGGLTFPKPAFSDFMMKTDEVFKELSTEDKFRTFGQHLPSIIKLQIKSHLDIFRLFQSACTACDVDEMYQRKFFDIWMEKFCNARINDRIFGKELTEVAENDKISGKTLNLRDELLTSHIKSKKSK